MRWHRSRLPAIPLRSPALRPTSSSTSVGLWNVKTGKFAMTGPGWVQTYRGSGDFIADAGHSPPYRDSYGGVTTVKGSEDQLARGIRLREGVYTIKWSGSGTYVSFSLTDIDGNGGGDISKGRASGERLFIVDSSSVLPGNFTLMAISDSDWAVSIARLDTSSPSTLPLFVSCSELDGAVTKPFRAHAGNIKISYASPGRRIIRRYHY